jgi:UV DNA damage repair endonuclease
MKLHQLFAQPNSWIQKQLARDANSFITVPRDHRAICWCAMGGLEKCYGFGTDAYNEAYDKLAARIKSDVIPWNDTKGRTQAEVRDICLELDI